MHSSGRGGFFVPIAAGADPGGVDTLERELRRKVVRVCREYIDRFGPLPLGIERHGLLARELTRARMLKASAINDDLATLKRNICHVVDRGNGFWFCPTCLRAPLLELEAAEAASTALVPYDTARGALTYN